MSQPHRQRSEQSDGELFRLLVENVRDYAIFVIDPEGHVENWNLGAERLLGYREEEVVGRSVAVLFTPEDIENGFPQREMQQALESGRGNDDRWHVRKDGTRFWCGGTLTPLWDEGRTLRGFAKIMRDRTERKRAEEERAARTREAERRQRLYNAVLSNTPDLVYVFDLGHRFTFANEGLLRLWGTTWDEAIGKTCLELGYEPWHAAMHDREIEQVVATRQPVKGEVPFTGTFGPRIYEYIFVPVLGESGEVEAVAGTTRDVTDRRQVEEQVRHSEQLHRAIAELSADYAFDGAIGPDGAVRIERATAGFAKFYGLTLDEMNARGGWGSVVHADDHPVVVRTIERLMAGQTDRGEVRGVCADGSVKWQAYLTVPIRDASGRTVGLYGAATDVSAQRLLTDQLRGQAESLSAILTATVDNIYLLDKDGRYRYVSLGGARVLGLEPGQMTGKRWQELGLPADVMERFDAQRERALDTGEPQRHEVTFPDRVGGHHYEYTIAPVRAENGSFEAVVVVSRDDTERKRAEEALRATSATLRSFYDTAPVMMGVVEVRGEDVLHLTDNAATGRFFGTDPVSLAGRTASEMGVPPGHLREWVRAYRESERTGQPVRFEYPHEAPTGRRWVSAIVYCIEALAGRRCRCSYVAQDVTEQKRVEEALRDADRRKDEFLATLAHELRNPLAPIRNALQILKMSRAEAATVERSRAIMERQVNHLVRLVDDLLDVSRVMRGKIVLRRERVELATVVARAVETVQPLVDAQRHELSVRLPPESLPLDADPVRLVQVVGNLLTNAAKYTEPAGRIRLTADRDGDGAVLRVRDNGIGIAPDVLPHVFELFFQADHATTKTQGGLGIGLTLVKNLVELHGGTVEARSDGPCKGCEFVVWLPLIVQGLGQDQSGDTERTAQEAPPPSGTRLLVVDDNQDAADSFAMLLRLQGHEVRVAHSGRAALEVATVFKPDLIFLDLGMPGMDGYEVSRRVRETPGLEDVVLAALTGWGQPDDRRRTTEAGFDHHLVKPPDPQVVEGVLAGLKRPDDR